MKYLLLAYTGASQWDEQSVTQEEVARICREYAAFEDDLRRRGEFVASEGLADPGLTTTLSRSGNEVVVSDGPFLETRESLVSYVLVDVAEHARALEIASRMVSLSGETCELRPVMDLDLPDLDG